MSDPARIGPSPSGMAKVTECEAAALRQVTDQQQRILRLAQEAFQGDLDPIRIFAETVARSSVVHVNAMILLQRAQAERIQALSGLQASYNPPVPQLPFPGVLRMFGVVPVDPVRFRIGAIFVVVSVLLAAFGLGVLVAKI